MDNRETATMKLHSIPEPDGLSAHAKDIGDMAALFVSITQRTVQAMIEEADKCQPGDEARRVLVAPLETDLKFIAEVLSAAHQSMTDVWTDITSARSRLHANADPQQHREDHDKS